MLHHPGVDKERRRLRFWLLLIFCALAIPTAILVVQAYSQLKWQAFHQSRLLAEEQAVRINRRLVAMISNEQARSFREYSFLESGGDKAAGVVQRSPLSAFPVQTAIPGLISYFQVDSKGVFTTPLLPKQTAGSANYGIAPAQQAQRLALQRRVQQILARNRLLRHAPQRVKHASKSPARKERAALAGGSDKSTAQEMAAPAAVLPEAPAPAALAFDQLEARRGPSTDLKQIKPPDSLGRVENLQLDDSYTKLNKRKSTVATNEPRIIPGRKRDARQAMQGLAPARRRRAAKPLPADLPAVPSTVRINTFASELDPFVFSLLDSGHFVLFRNAWRGGERYIQGALIARQAFIQGMMTNEFQASALSGLSTLGIAYAGEIQAVVGGQTRQANRGSANALNGALLHRARLSAPLADLELIFSVTRLPAAPGADLVKWLAVILFVVLCGGFYLIYQLGVRQIRLARQQQDFVSAVSHELRTPLTSIRMYGEILLQGWASEDKKQRYYEYIFTESERLSRLIANVLKLAGISRNALELDLTPVCLGAVMEEIQSKIAAQMERTGFTIQVELSAELAACDIALDEDAFSQIVINLVDNAIKFSAEAKTRRIDLAWRRSHGGVLQFSVRDYGPGVPRQHMKKIFTLFYRGQSEDVRDTIGTGIGLALVQQLAAAMNAKVDVVNKDPGAEFRLSFILD